MQLCHIIVKSFSHNTVLVIVHFNVEVVRYLTTLSFLGSGGATFLLHFSLVPNALMVLPSIGQTKDSWGRRSFNDFDVVVAC